VNRIYLSRARRLLVAPLLLAACTSTPPPPPANTAASDALVLRNFTLIDGSGGAPVADAALVAENGRITWIGRASALQAPAGATVQDLTGAFVMPGLVNLHGHVAGSDGITQDPKTQFTRENVLAHLRLYASYGVTTVVSMGTDQPIVYDIIREQRGGRPREARIFTAGRGFTAKGGYPTQPGGIPGVPYELATPEDAATAMKELAAQHPDLVKIWIDDHFGAMPKLPIPVAKAIIDAAHANNIKAAAHIFYADDAMKLSEAGLDAFVHSVRDRALTPAEVATIKQRGTWMAAATLSREASMFEFAAPDALLDDPFFVRAVPAKVQDLMKTTAYRDRIKSDPHFSDYPTYLKNAQRNLKLLADAGVPVGFGTDTGPPNRFGGYGEHWEAKLMIDAGLTPSQVITAATKSGAQFLNSPDIGTLEMGKVADLLVLEANPLDDIANTRRIRAVYVAGHPIK
jgi:imidazolonepropionase-like amidohydrolase